jgi:hypothetical protein
LGERLAPVSIEVEGQAGVVVDAGGEPEAGRGLVADAAADGVALIFRVRKVAGVTSPPTMSNTRIGNKTGTTLAFGSLEN